MTSAKINPAHISVCISSVPERRKALYEVVRRLAPQVGHIYVWLEDTTTPDPVLYGRPTIQQVFGGIRVGSIAKLYLASTMRTPYVLVCDDDIDYPTDYAQRMCSEVDYRQCPVVVGSRTFTGLAEFRKPSDHVLTGDGHIGSYCNYFASSTLAFRPGMFEFPRQYDYLCEDDAELSVTLQLQHVPIWCIARQPGWLRAIDLPQGTPTLWDAARRQGFRDRQELLNSVPDWTLWSEGDRSVED